MIINTTQVEMVLSNKAIPAYTLESETGMSRATISKFRKNEVDFEKISLKNIMAIQKWIDDGNYTFSYDYSNLIEELEADISEGLVKDYLFVVRGKWLEAINTAPIIDYYYSLDDLHTFSNNDTVQKLKTEQVLKEMKHFNQLF
ncbi:hypothetical protein [Streptococcus mutans]|uniref:hypothetical protein n=1 Tax=Streptococcus mutans TaxID=1309 RepID=UPI0002B58386|nr:hypothetical protein [Streptococcus mutans]EMC43570.1 hypothetical protein SMU99_07665 [Streptococcus mutans 24]